MFKILKNLNKKDWLWIFVSTGLIVASVWLDLKMPSYMSEITTLLKMGGSANDILVQGLYMLACALGSALITVLVSYIFARVATSFSARLRYKVFNHVQDLSMSEIKKFSTSSLITRTTNDVNQIQNFLAMGVNSIIRAPVLAVWAITIIVGKSWQWSMVTAICVVLLMAVVSVLVVLVLPRFKKMQTLTDNLNRVTRENLTGVRVVRAYNAEEFEKEKFEKVNEELTSNNRFAMRALNVMSPFMSLLMNALSLSIYWIGAMLINNVINPLDKISLFGDMVTFGSYAMQIVGAFIMLIMLFIMMPRALVSSKRLNEILDTQSSIKEGVKNEFDDNIHGEVEFRNVSFKYPDADKYVIKNVSFKAERGQTVAFIGSTGSGKSTLINLVPRLYDATEGEVLINGVNVKEYTSEALNNRIGYVSQKALMFRGTIRSNVAYGDAKEDITKDDIDKAINIAQATELVSLKENGINSEITQGGTNLSGGQRQRLSIARAIAKKPEILIFDDSFSALDYMTDKKLREEIKNQIKDTTSLIVAQRIGTIKNADLILVLDSGNVVGKGTHDELMETCEVYKEIAYSQLSKEELDND